MLKDLIGKYVYIQFNLWHAYEGELIEVDEIWVKLKLKNKIILIKADKIISVSAAHS